MAHRAASSGRSRSFDSLVEDVWSGAPSGRRTTPPSSLRPAIEPATCLVLDIARLGLTRDRGRRVQILASSAYQAGLRFSLAAMGNDVGVVCHGGRYGAQAFFEQVISLTYTRSFGTGERVWLSCDCGRRAGKLYLPPGETAFACAECLDLHLNHDRGAAVRWRGRTLDKATLEWAEPLSHAV